MKKIFFILFFLFSFLILFGYSKNFYAISGNESEYMLYGDVRNDAVQVIGNNFENMSLITNANYFIANPLHHINDGSDNPLGTCTTVAAQLLIGYHNYYSDRRLIPMLDYDGSSFLESDFGDVNFHPIIYPSQSEGQGRGAIGTADYFYEKLFEFNEYASIIGFGQHPTYVLEGVNDFFEEYASNIVDDINITYSNYSKNTVMNELNCGRPAILGFEFLETSSLHNVIVYGSAYHDDVFGYIVHYGWGEENCYVWVPETWCSYQITMSIDHVHDYQDGFQNLNLGYRKIECSTCGCTSISKLYNIDELTGTLKGLYFEIAGEHILPSKIYNIDVEVIDSYAFNNCSNLRKISIPSSVKTIKQFAFNGCQELDSVRINGDDDILVNIENYAFNNCQNLSSIFVDNYKFIDYKKSNICYEYRNLIKTIRQFDTFYLDNNCTYTFNELVYKGSNNIIKLSIPYDNDFEFVFNCLDSFNVHIYNHNFDLIEDYYIVPGQYMNKQLLHLVQGEFYIILYLSSSETNKRVEINIKNSNYYLSLEEGTSYNIINDFYRMNEINFGYRAKININESGFYKITLNGLTSDGNNYECNGEEINIYDSLNQNNLILKYGVLYDDIFAVNDQYQNELFVIFQDTTYYLNIIIQREFIQTLELNITPVDENNIDLFNFYGNQIGQLINYNISFNADNIQKFIFNQSISLKIQSQGFYGGKIFILKEESNNNQIQLTNLIIFDTLNNNYNKSLSLEHGTYYIGFVRATFTNNASCLITRILTDYGEGFLQPDVEDAPLFGTEVTLNGGEYNSNVITQGFTRLINLYNKDSRLDYYWYTNNENVARITSFGTIMALNVNIETSVLIMAVNKNDPSKAYIKEFIIVPDDKTFDSNPLEYYLNISFNKDNLPDSVQVNLNNLNVPINWLQYYTWSSLDENISISNYGVITLNDNIDVGEYQLNGFYELNSRVIIHITLLIE